MLKYLKAIPTAIPAILWAWIKCLFYSKKKDKYPLNKRYRFIRWLAKAVYNSFRVDIHVEGLENIPNRPFTLFSNHRSMIDPAIYIGLLDSPLAVVAKKELLKVPPCPPILKSIDCEFLDRNDLKQSLKTMMRVQNDLENGGHNWLIFPEGTRNKDAYGLLNEFHHGTFRPAVKAKVDIVPAVIFGTAEFMSKKHSYKKYPVYVKFLKPISYVEYQNLSTEEIAKSIQNKIQSELSFNARPYFNHYMSQHYPKKYINK